MNTSRAECLVVGGGLAGGMAALRLAQAGCDVLLIEKERAPHHKVCGEFLSPEALHYLHMAGIDAHALGAATIEHVRLSSGHHSVAVDLPFRALSLSRSILDEVLLTRAARAGCRLHRGAAVERLTNRAERLTGEAERPLDAAGNWTAELSDGSSISAATVFLAAGKHDLRGFARSPGSQNDLVGFKLHWLLDPAQKAALRGCMELFLFRGGYGGLSLVESDFANLCLVVQRRVLRALGGWPQLLKSIRGECELIEERLAGGQPAWDRPLAISSIPYGYMATNNEAQPAGLWPIGDQAAVIPSFTGDGMSIALHSACLAADTWLAGRDVGRYLDQFQVQLRPGMGLATLLSRAMVTPAGRWVAPELLRGLPGGMRWIASRTRIPAQFLASARLESAIKSAQK